nr:Na/Pi cotransporter family protein [Tissierella sp.]
MDIALPVLGGLGLFLYGMNVMSTGLQKVAGTRLKKIIGALTQNKFLGLLVGIAVTSIVQSSSATTVMVIGFVNAGMMTLIQATAVIMGANIGTTITSQIIAFNLTDYAPLAVVAGIILFLFTSKKKTKELGEILIGVGILFIGMDMMGSGLEPLAQLPAFATIVTSLSNPFLGMLVGIGLTTVLQSSSAATGLLQALAAQGLIGMGVIFPILLGENIGTTTTALLSSIGANKTAKRAALIHLIFNLVGTLIFITVLRYPVEWLVKYLTPNNLSRQIANAHTFFNVINVAIQFPFAIYLVKLVERLVPGEEEGEKPSTIYLDERIIETPSIAIGQTNKEVLRMGNIVLDSLKVAHRALIDKEYGEVKKILETEVLVNKIEREITDYVVKLSNAPISNEEHEEVNHLLYTINDIERIGDHVENMGELAQYMNEHDIVFSEDAVVGLKSMFSKCEKIVDLTMQSFESKDFKMAREVVNLEEAIDVLEEKNRTGHIERLNQGLCSTEPGIMFLDTLSNLERVADHSVNIAGYILENFK